MCYIWDACTRFVFIILNVLQTLCTAYYSYLKLIFLSLTYFVSPASKGCKFLVTLIFLTPPCTSSESYFSKIHNLKTGIFYKVWDPWKLWREKIFWFDNGAFGCPKMSISRSPLRLEKKTLYRLSICPPPHKHHHPDNTGYFACTRLKL